MSELVEQPEVAPLGPGPDLSTVYQRLLLAGKPKRLALAALARKLVVIANAVLRHAKAASAPLT